MQPNDQPEQPDNQPAPFVRAIVDNTGKLMTRRIAKRDGTTLVLAYRHLDALALRALADGIHLKGDKKPTLSLLARRSLDLYRQLLETNPRARAIEIEAMNGLTTRHPKPAKVSRKKATRNSESLSEKTLTPIEQCAAAFAPKKKAT